MKFKLNPYIESTYHLPAVRLNSDGTKKMIHYSLEPNKVYESTDYEKATPNSNQLIQNQVTYIPYSVQTKTLLEKLTAPYEIDAGCKSCGGKISQIKLKTFVEVE